MHTHIATHTLTHTCSQIIKLYLSTLYNLFISFKSLCENIILEKIQLLKSLKDVFHLTYNKFSKTIPPLYN